MLLTSGEERVTSSFYKTRAIQPEELQVGKLVVAFRDGYKEGMYYAPKERDVATIRRWWMGRIVSTAGVVSGQYVLLAGGYRAHIGNLRVVIPSENQKEQEVVHVSGEADAHFMGAAHWLVTRSVLGDSLQHADVAVALKTPSAERKGQGLFMLTSTGQEFWTANAWRTRPAKESDLESGIRVFMFRDQYDGAGKVYKAPPDRSETLSRRWWAAKVIDTSSIFKGQVQVNNNMMVDVQALRVVVEQE
jgi:hypothetical protein